MPNRVLPFLLGLLVSLTLLLSACDDSPGGDKPSADRVDLVEDSAEEIVAQPQRDERWQIHLAATPAGTISARAPIIFRFSHPVVDTGQLNQPASGVVTLEPQLPVTAVFTSEDRLEIRPQEPLPQGKILTLTLHPQGLANVDDSLPPAPFALQVMEQSVALTVKSLLPTDNGEQMILAGTLETRDLADNDAIEKILSATQQEQARSIEWQHDSAGLMHQFQVVGLVRGDNESQVMLHWDSAPLGLEDQGQRNYAVPALRTFQVTNVRVVSYPKPHVEVNFSEALDKGQNLNGLVTLNGKTPRLEVDGSRLKVYPQEKVDNDVNLVIEAGLRSATRIALKAQLKKTLTLMMNKPGVRFAGEGSILPAGERLSVPFEAVAVSSVKVQAFQIFEDNIGHYLQNNELDEGALDRSEGRYLWQKTLTLPDTGEGWQRYQLDLTELMAKHPNGLVHLTLTIDSDDIRYTCNDQQPTSKTALPEDYEGPGQQQSADAVARYYEDSGYLSWSERNNPCSDSYYRYNDLVTSTRAFLASNLGLIAKRGQDNTLHVIATELSSNQPAGDVVIKVYNYQQQQVAMGLTNGEGMASLTLDGTPFYLQAVKGRDTGYLKLARNRALPTNQFNTGGVQVRDGLKGFFYGERDVWRPGDDIHLTFILEDKQQTLPDNHPLTLDWFDPRGNKVNSYTVDTPVGDFYAFTLSTSEDAPTGNWRAVARLGQRYFDTPVRVEAIKPNRLKIELELPDKLYANEKTTVGLFSQWLNGATAANLKADVKVRVATLKTTFPGLDAYHFDDDTRSLSSEPFNAFEGSIDGQGKASFPLTIPVEQTPGMLRAVLTTRVFENSGDYSTQVRGVPVYPFKHWVGMRIPKGSGWGNSLARDSQHAIDLVSVDSAGKAEAGRPLDITVYEIDWRWWWDRADDDLSNFISDSSTKKVSEAQITTDAQGRGQWLLNGADYDWGRHVIRVCDRQSEHCTAQTVYLGWSWDRASGSQDAATRLSLSADKERYQVGEIAHVELPAVSQGRLLVSLETGSQILKHYWLPATGAAQTLDIPVTANMAPNIYVHVALLQPHQGRDNDRPIRLYGIVPLLVEDPATVLKPQIKAPQKVEPQDTFTVKVSEQQGKAMTYTLALVDEGLLGITNFQTPNPHDAFYRREALGVLTWDLFDMVVGAYGAELDRLLALGGSDGSEDGKEKQRRRFPPVVQFLGPFTLEANKTARHEVTLPAYMGQVRAMVVAGQAGAYGKAEQDITVTQPLTLLSTLPRVLGPGETVALPVTVFVTEDEIKKVKLSVKADGELLSVEQGSAELAFTGPSDQIAMLRLKAKEGTGMASVTVTAKAGKHQASETIHLPVRAANPPTTRDVLKKLEPGESWQTDYQPHGMAGTNSANLLVSALPAMGLERRLDYLLRYPHGCIEQTTSSVLPQLYLNQLLALSEEQQQEIQSNVSAGIARLQRFQLSGGGFSYWPGLARANDWGTSYAGHFLLEAKRLGYAVPADMLTRWSDYQMRQSQSVGERPWQWSSEAYRLYTLALAGQPQVGAMNRLRERLNLASKEYARSGSYHNGRWLLAAAYQQLGLSEVARELMVQQAADLHDDRGYSYGSPLRDRAILLLVEQSLGHDQQAWDLARGIADQLASQRWYSTQTTAWSLMAMAGYAGSDSSGNNYNFAWRQGSNGWQEVSASAPISREAVAKGDEASTLAVRNNSPRRLFVTLSQTGIPMPGDEQPVSDGIRLAVDFFADGKPISPASLTQGQDFSARVTVTNLTGNTLQDVALTQILPSGWQITSSRLDGSATEEAGDSPVTYTDLRDDRVMHYFDLKPGNRHAITLNVDLNASFTGRFYLPSWTVEAMYDGRYQARSRGQWVEVQR